MELIKEIIQVSVLCLGGRGACKSKAANLGYLFKIQRHLVERDITEDTANSPSLH